MRVYLDNAATTPIDPEVIEAMIPVMRDLYGNPSSIHSHGREARSKIEECRKKVASLMGAAPSEIFFTSGGTEADNMAIRCGIQHLGIKTVISSKIEHHAVLNTIKDLQKNSGINVHYVNLLPNGHVDLADLERLLNENPGSLVSLMHANNEIGNLLDIDRVSELCQKHGAYFHCDTVQTIGHVPIDLKKTKIHFLACAAHKFNGPKGVGFIYINSDVKILPFITGGSQERNMRGGTENIIGIVGLAKALEVACRDMEVEMAKIQEIKDYMIASLKSNIPGVEFNGDYDGRSLLTVLSVSFPPTPMAEMLLFKLDIEGISASGGSACSSGSNVGSHVLTGINCSPERPSLRFSFGKQNTKEEIDYVVGKLKELVMVPSTSNQ